VGTSSATSASVSDTGMLFHTTGPAHEVINSYEINRNVLKVKENEEKAGTNAGRLFRKGLKAHG
jgi:hypothetical protein